MSDDNKIRTGLWKKESTNGGAAYYGGGKVTITQPGEYWVNVYKNDRKETDKHPDLNTVLTPVDGLSTSGRPSKPPAPVPAQEAAFVDDDLPF